MVPLTDATSTQPGVRVWRLPPRMGSPLDHCLTLFDRVQLDRRALPAGAQSGFTEAGAFVSELHRGRRHLMALQRVVTERLCMSACAIGGARALLATSSPCMRENPDRAATTEAEA
ncbi:hypothetical protein [Streptomyces roseochromogenus]|uniref:Uncharacterized protein n=1 Tax=Streptomyces roseochromogenus subsp. oscitans DS 12.976 TaxID=1352936 RepID=V6JYL8_STRRC|nr:hypothetical protein [Streptomyces roseochromogenus]EST24211.1 hypothetical protein M878_31515 [Streptomyces roseochromogenus subsp. oscitans DS 12.976]